MFILSNPNNSIEHIYELTNNIVFVISEKEIADDSYDNIWCGDLWDNMKVKDYMFTHKQYLQEKYKNKQGIIFVGFKF